ncbi:hypothetical protein GCM10010109_89930 [Actinoplanes campanulatus]|nr:hypothetical protein GCM10010109_89930 [Actinoplanes campanulatus]GID42084.1 hypothetical protein Aca09nite_85900 [Actinoplanes campanulatus]
MTPTTGPDADAAGVTSTVPAARAATCAVRASGGRQVRSGRPPSPIRVSAAARDRRNSTVSGLALDEQGLHRHPGRGLARVGDRPFHQGRPVQGRRPIDRRHPVERVRQLQAASTKRRLAGAGPDRLPAGR